MLEKSNGTPADDMICYIERLQKEEERLVDMVADKSIRIHSLEQQVIQLHATVEDQRKMILSWQRKVAPGGDIDELRAEVEKWRIAEGEAMLVVKSQELTIERLREMYKTDTITWRDKYWAAKAELEAAHTASEEGE